MDFKELAKQTIATNRALQRAETGSQRLRNTPPPPAVSVTPTGRIVPTTPTPRPPRATEAHSYTTIETANSRGELYTIVVPSSYVKYIPDVWAWDDIKYMVAELIAKGTPMVRIPKQHRDIPDVQVLYAWMKHPEFKTYIDNLIMNTGHADKQGRIAGLKAVTEKIFDLIMDNISAGHMSEKSVSGILTAYHTMSKQLAQEKEEFFEQSRVQSQSSVTVDGKLNVNANVNINEILTKVPTDERNQLERELNAVGDEIVRQMLGGTEVKE